MLLTTDQRGLPGPPGAACDLGAYEVQTVFPYQLSVPSGNTFHLGDQPNEFDFFYDATGLMAYAKAWNYGNVTQYTVSNNFAIRPTTGDLNRVEEIEVTVSIQHSGVGGTGCSDITLVSPWTDLLEVCDSTTIRTLQLKTNTQYRIETNAQAYSRNGEVAEHRSEMHFQITSGRTLVGQNISAQPIDATTGLNPVFVTFSNVTQAGLTSLTTTSNGPPPPAGFSLGDPPLYYELTTTASFSGPITVCINYTDTSFSGAAPRLFHLENGVWVDRMVSMDSVNNITCASVPSLSPFALFISTPLQALCRDITVSTDPGLCSAASVSINNGSSGPDGDAITLQQVPAGPYALGTTAVTLTITDTEKLSASCNANVTVVDRQPPTISCPAPIAECTSPSGAAVSFNSTAADNCPGLPTASCTKTSGSSFALGSTAFSCSVTDGSGNGNTCTSTVTVRDTKPPVISAASASPQVLWPPNNTLVPVSVSVLDADTCDPNPLCKITQITSNEAITSADAQITGNLTTKLRAQRLGSGTGRLYTLTLQCTDASGNSSTADTTVSVPHDQGKSL